MYGAGAGFSGQREAPRDESRGRQLEHDVRARRLYPRYFLFTFESLASRSQSRIILLRMVSALSVMA